MKTNDNFIKNVFDKMVEVSPELVNLLKMDFRFLPNSIVNSYPWPVGNEIRRLLCGNMEKLDRGRLDQILKTAERTIQFLTFMLLIQLSDEILKKEILIPENFRKEFTRRFSLLTLGNYVFFIREIGKIFKENNIVPFCEELDAVLGNKFYNKLSFWVEERNDIQHHKVNLTEEEVEARCLEYMTRLEDILCDLAFLIKYPFLSVNEIHVIKYRHTKELFVHKMHFLNSSSSSFMGGDEEFSNYTNSPCVIMVKNLQETSDVFLNFFPLILSTHQETGAMVKKDIYMYRQWEDNEKKIHFTGTETTEKVDLRSVSYYNHIIREFEEVIRVFSPKE